MQFTYTGSNPFFLEQSFFDLDGNLSIEVSSASTSEVVLSHTIFTQANVSVTLRGFGFVVDGSGNFLLGQITSIEFNGLDIRQATISDINWSAAAFQEALNDIETDGDYAGVAALFNSSGPISIDASGALGSYDQETTWTPFLPLLTQPISFIGSRFDDSVIGTSANDTINAGNNSRDGDRIAASTGDDLIIFDLPEGNSSPGFVLDYDRIEGPVTFSINGITNSGTATNGAFTDRFQDVDEALQRYLGIEGTAEDDTYNVTLAPNQIVALIGGPGADTYNISAEGAVPILDFFFSSVTSGVAVNFDTGTIANDGFGATESFDITGNPLRTVLLATNEADAAIDGAGNQLVRLYAGNDVFLSRNLGNDSIDGGSGTDAIIFEGINQSQATITFDGALSTFSDRQNPDNSTTMLGIERIETEDELVFELGNHDGIGLIPAADLVALTELYIAYFNRAADALGLSFWATAFQKNGFTLREIADLFFTQPETVALYSDVSDADFVRAVYNNVLGRVADQDGLDFWTGQLAAGNVTESGFIVDFLAGARADTGSPADVRFVETKTEIGLYFAVIQGQSDVTAANAVMSAYDGSTQGRNVAIGLADDAFNDALTSTDDLLLPVVGVIENPFPDVA